MEPILIYGFPLGSSMGLVAALEWLGKPYRLCRVDMLGEMREPAYARINARHETPALITDQGKVLTETMAIAHWLAARDDERRISPDPLSAEGDRMRQIMAFINTGFTGAFTPLWVALEMDPPRPTLADALFIGVARWLDFHEVAEPVRWPKLAALRARLGADPAVVYATALESGESAAGGGACLGHVPLAEVIARYGA